MVVGTEIEYPRGVFPFGIVVYPQGMEFESMLLRFIVIVGGGTD